MPSRKHCSISSDMSPRRLANTVRPLVQETKKEVDIKGKVTILKRAVKHVLTHQVLLADFLLLEPEVQPQLPTDYQWVPEESLDDYAVPRLVEHLFEAVRINDEKSY